MAYRALVPFALLFVFGCGNGGGDNPDADVPDGGDGFGYPLVDCDILVPEYCGYPFPSNVYTVEDEDTVTGRRLSLSSDLLVGGTPDFWNRSDGFSAGTSILAQLPGATDDGFVDHRHVEDSLEANSPTVILDAETGELVPHFALLDARAGDDGSDQGIHLRPVTRLRDNARYIVALRNVLGDDDQPVASSPAFAALRDGTAFDDDDSIDARRNLYEDIFQHLSDAGIERNTVQLAWDFNTASDENNTRWLLHMRDDAFERIGENGPEYTITETLTAKEAGLNPGDIAFQIRGTVHVPLYMSSAAAGSLLVFGDDGLPTVNAETPWADVPFRVLIPNSALKNPASLLMYGHGLLGTDSQIRSGHFQSFINTYNYVFFAADLQGMSDGDFGPIAGGLTSGNIANLRTMFDRLHQGFLNWLVLMRMMKTTFGTNEGDEALRDYIDPTRAFYYGISQGGIMGTVFAALSDDIERAALGVMGQPYSLLLFRSVDFTPFLDILKVNTRDPRDHELFVAALQMLWDRVEPTGYTHHITTNTFPNTPAKTVLLRDALADHQVTNIGAHLMARTIGAVHLNSGLQDIWGLTKVNDNYEGTALIEYDFGLPGDPLCNVPPDYREPDMKGDPLQLCEDPHEHVRRLDEARIQLDEFLQTGVITNHCDAGLCSFPEMSGCRKGVSAADLPALCDAYEAAD